VLSLAAYLSGDMVETMNTERLCSNFRRACVPSRSQT